MRLNLSIITLCCRFPPWRCFNLTRLSGEPLTGTDCCPCGFSAKAKWDESASKAVTILRNKAKAAVIFRAH
jgi:hypothetical protein